MNCLILVLSFLSLFAATDPIDQAKTKYLDKPVVVKSAAFRLAVKDTLGYRSKSVFEFIPEKYIGQKAMVIAVQESEDAPHQAPTQKVNAMGEVINTNPPASSDFDIIVKFEDGLLAIRKETLQAAAYDLLLPDDVAKLEQLNRANLENTEKLVGRDFYATALSSIYRSDVSLAEMQPANRISPQFLEPLHVLAAKWNEQARCAIVKLELPSKTQALAMMAADGGTCYGSNLEPGIPKFFSAQDIYGVKNRTVAIGMKEMAVHWAIGYPEKVNDWGRGGKQLVYGDYLMVYVDTSGKVEDVQRFQR